MWLCEDHRSDDFQRRRAGRDFVVSLLTVWRAAGPVNKLQSKALADHLQRVRQPQPQGDRKGSYAWPRLREEAELRFAAGEDPNRVIPDLQRRYEGLPINAPTERTLRRWFTDGRWLVRSPKTHDDARPVDDTDDCDEANVAVTAGERASSSTSRSQVAPMTLTLETDPHPP